MADWFVYQEFVDPDFGNLLKCMNPEGHEAETAEDALANYAMMEHPKEGEYVLVNFELGQACRLLLAQEVTFTIEEAE